MVQRLDWLNLISIKCYQRCHSINFDTHFELILSHHARTGVLCAWTSCPRALYGVACGRFLSWLRTWMAWQSSEGSSEKLHWKETKHNGAVARLWVSQIAAKQNQTSLPEKSKAGRSPERGSRGNNVTCESVTPARWKPNGQCKHFRNVHVNVHAKGTLWWKEEKSPERGTISREVHRRQ